MSHPATPQVAPARRAAMASRLLILKATRAYASADSDKNSSVLVYVGKQDL
ncbi:hypothetical protein ACP70R_002154 [Stipagrostis hirtigluma subsp. patula]